MGDRAIEILGKQGEIEADRGIEALVSPDAGPLEAGRSGRLLLPVVPVCQCSGPASAEEIFLTIQLPFGPGAQR